VGELMEDQKYSLTTADPSGYWLIPNGVNDPKQWACMDSADPVKEIDDLRAKLAEAEDELAASKQRIQQLYASHDRKDAKITDLRIKIENAEMLAERRKWGAEEMDRLREDKARLIDLIDEAQKDILVRSHSDVQAAIADVGRRLRAAIDKAGGE